MCFKINIHGPLGTFSEGLQLLNLGPVWFRLCRVRGSVHGFLSGSGLVSAGDSPPFEFRPSEELSIECRACRRERRNRRSTDRDSRARARLRFLAASVVQRRIFEADGRLHFAALLLPAQDVADIIGSEIACCMGLSRWLRRTLPAHIVRRFFALSGNCGLQSSPLNIN